MVTEWMAFARLPDWTFFQPSWIFPASAVPVDIVAINDDIPDINSNSKLNPLLLLLRAIPLCHVLLYRHRAANRVYHAGEFDEDAVPCGLDDPTSMFRDLRVDNFEPRERAFLIRAHKPAVASDIGGQNGCKLAFDALSRHGEAPFTLGGSLP
jgi:hypothetical protein